MREGATVRKGKIVFPLFRHIIRLVAGGVTLLSSAMESIVPTITAAVRVKRVEMKQIDRFYNKLCIDDVSFQKFKHKTTPC